ncbi:hypothetical protein BJX61DRAFT_542320 [Aspergillus egyptiacus]|nr:hypothetical protein BJX61DRAFT_542320 [Aspergillus egyptiacus]
MRLSTWLCAWVLSPAPHFVAAEATGSNSTSVPDSYSSSFTDLFDPVTHDSNTTSVPSVSVDIDVLVVTSPGVTTSTLGIGCEKGNSAYNCITFTKDYVYTHTFTRVPVTSTTGTLTSTTPTSSATSVNVAGPSSFDSIGMAGSDTEIERFPNKTISTLSGADNPSGYMVHPKAVRRRDIDLTQRDDDPDDPLPSDPLPSVPSNPFQISRWMREIAKRLTSEGKWLDHEKDDTVGKWYPFIAARTAAGVKGLFGCTSVMIVSPKGVYASHIYEDPVFVQKGKDGYYRPTPDEYFQKASFDALITGSYDGNEHPESIEPINDLIGTNENPGPLHHTFQPKVFVISPFKQGKEGPLKFPERVQWLSDKFHNYLYPDGSSDNGQKPSTIAYKAPAENFAENPNSPDGKAIMEFSPIDHYERSPNGLRAIARWRLFANAKEMASWEFVNEASPSCPVSTTTVECVTTTEPNSKRSTTAAQYSMTRAVARSSGWISI